MTNSVWILVLWITFKAADGGITIEAEFEFRPGSNRAVCEDFYHETRREMMLHGIPETNENGEEIILYPSKVEGRCELAEPMGPTVP